MPAVADGVKDVAKGVADVSTDVGAAAAAMLAAVDPLVPLRPHVDGSLMLAMVGVGVPYVPVGPLVIAPPGVVVPESDGAPKGLWGLCTDCTCSYCPYRSDPTSTG
jgi:hypothetical protein